MTVDLTPTQVLAGLGVLLTLVMVWRSGSRRARRAAEVARTSSRVVSLAGRVLFTAAAIVGAQWLVITYATSNTTLLVVALALPDLLAAHVLTRTLTVTSMDTTSRRGDRR
ncbi:hypothetical protein [Amycolatopsis nigrescens]|uniref:hypothetical protein n=1 Tax=Amycolatopsis nigrescens TaxID=381445 RepID=UPI0003726204|nr:hypothetical protein [Amycolatopsis nigrescens]